MGENILSRGERTPSCQACARCAEVRTARSRFLLRELSVTNADDPKYSLQLVVKCSGFQSKDEATRQAPTNSDVVSIHKKDVEHERRNSTLCRLSDRWRS